MTPPLPFDSETEQLQDELAELKVEHQRLKESYAKIANASADAHRSAAIWAQFSSKLSRMLGEELLKEIQWPEDDYVKRFVKAVLEDKI